MIGFHSRLMNFCVIAFIAVGICYTFSDNEKHEIYDNDIERKIMGIKNNGNEKKSDVKIVSMTASISSETINSIEKFLNEHFKDQMEILIQLKNSKK